MPVNVLFVCLGNICRSPMAEAVFQRMVDDAGLSGKISVDSAGIGNWHSGEKAHSGTRAILKKHGIDYSGRARQIRLNDMLSESSYIIVMDESNMTDITERYGQHPKLYRLLDFAAEAQTSEVPDPYYSGKFEEVFQLVANGCQGLLASIRENEGLDGHR